jgi:hypothetical protein
MVLLLCQTAVPSSPLCKTKTPMPYAITQHFTSTPSIKPLLRNLFFRAAWAFYLLNTIPRLASFDFKKEKVPYHLFVFSLPPRKVSFLFFSFFYTHVSNIYIVSFGNLFFSFPSARLQLPGYHLYSNFSICPLLSFRS